MTLPAIVAPIGTPVFLADGHSIAEDSVFADVPMGSGHARRRRVSTVAERIVSVRWFLDAGDMEAVDAWYEDVLQAGTLAWSALVANQGAGLLWWEARWAEPPQYQMLHRGRALLTGQLFLIGEGSETGPVLNILSMELSAALIDTRSSIVLPTGLSMELVAALVQPTVLTMELTAALLSSYEVIVNPCANLTPAADSGGTFDSEVTLTTVADSGETFDSCELIL